MSDPTFAEKDAAVVLAEALAVYKAETGVTLAPADPRRLHLQALLLLLAQLRGLIDFAGKQNLIRYVSSLWIEALAELWGLQKLAAGPSQVTLRYTATTPGVLTIPAGKRATDGISLWAVVETTTSAPASSYVDVTALCTTNGASSNGVAIGQIDTIVDSIPGIASVSNTTETSGGRNVEDLEDFRERIRQEPERFAVAGPRGAYQALARAASANVADAVALGADDAAEMAGSPPAPGEVRVLITEATLDDDGEIIDIDVEPSDDLKGVVLEALSAEDVRPLTDSVFVETAEVVEYDVDAVYYIARSRSSSAVEIQAKVDEAYAAYKLWQAKIGRDVNPSELIARLVVAGAKRVAVTSPAFVELARDEVAKLDYDSLSYGGLEDD